MLVGLTILDSGLVGMGCSPGVQARLGQGEHRRVLSVRRSAAGDRGTKTDIYRPHALFSMATGEGSRQVTSTGHRRRVKLWH